MSERTHPSPRVPLLVVTAFAVVGDAVLLPFYPQVFAARFGVTAPESVGLYLAAMCLVVMTALPLWARLLRGAAPLRLLVWTQGGAALLCVLCAKATTFTTFLAVSLLMFGLKASYLLVYPYLLSLEAAERRAGTIGTLTIIVQFGAIAGALVGGLVLQSGAGAGIFYVMAASDLAQMAICHRLEPRAGSAEVTTGLIADAPAAPILRLCLAMLVFYFGAYVVRPFFASYWIEVSGRQNVALSGLVYALPAAAALAALAGNRFRKIEADDLRRGFAATVGMGVGGLLLQAVPLVPAILVGRCLFGWASFQITVGLDAFLFGLSAPHRFAVDFGKANVAQNLGVVASSIAAGACVAAGGATATFLLAAAAFGATPLLLPQTIARASAPGEACLKETAP